MTNPTRRGIVVALVAMAISGCGAATHDPMDDARTWCHDRGGYIANTGWYEWSCVINSTPVPLPSPRDH
jgi:hypothetical protein